MAKTRLQEKYLSEAVKGMMDKLIRAKACLRGRYKACQRKAVQNINIKAPLRLQ